MITYLIIMELEKEFEYNIEIITSYNNDIEQELFILFVPISKMNKRYFRNYFRKEVKNGLYKISLCIFNNILDNIVPPWFVKCNGNILFKKNITNDIALFNVLDDANDSELLLLGDNSELLFIEDNSELLFIEDNNYLESY